MKLAEMADLLNGLASTMEPFMGKTAVNDLREVSNCFRQFPDDTVSTFCKYVTEARHGKKASQRAAANGTQDEKIAELVSRIQHYREHHKSYDYPAIRQLAADVAKLTNPAMKAVGERVGCHLSGTKPQMKAWLESWLTNLKATADQASFSLSSAGTG